PEDNIINGFVADEALSFMVWDADAEVEAWAEPEYLNGPEVFTPHGVTRLNLAAEVGEPQPHIWLSGYVNHFGQVDYDDEMTEDWDFVVENRGPGELVVSSITSDLNVFTFVDYQGGEFTLAQAERDTITVRFAPDAEEHFVGRLTLRSNDPDDPVIYIDVDGYGVEEVIEPDIDLSVNNYFFGVQHVNENGWPNGPFEFVLGISNVGGGELRVTAVNHAGSDAFSSDFEREVVIPQDETYNLTLTFDPDEAIRYDAMFTIVSDDPNDDIIQFPVRGIGSDSEEYFLHYPTPGSHAIIVQRAYLQLPDDGGEVDLSEGDEIGVFTPAGLCVGHVVLEDDGDIGLTAYANDPDSNIDDGFIAGSEMTFKFWDWTLGEVLEPVTIEWVAGPEVFEVDGETTVELSAEIEELERQVGVTTGLEDDEGNDLGYWDFGPVHVDDAVEHTIHIFNSGGQTLVINNVEPNHETLECDWDQEEVSLEAGQGFDLNVTFTPAAGLAYADDQIIVHSNDPDEPEFGIYMTGTGSEAEGHYDYYQGPADQSHSILVTLTMSGERASLYDEVGVFNGTGICCGSRAIEDPAQLLGVPAFGDDGGSDFLVEGFHSGEDIYFHIWDHSQGNEYIWEGEDGEVEVEVVAGQLRWVEGGLTRVNINVPDVFFIRPVDNMEVDEGDLVEFDLELVNPPVENMELEFANPDLIDGLGDWTLEDGTFSWETDPYESGRDDPYELQFRAYDPDDEDVADLATVIVLVNDINHAPEVVTEVRDQIFAWDEENEVWTFTVDEDADWVMVIPDLREFFTDPDGDELTQFWWDQVGGVGQEIRDPDEDDPYSYWIRVTEPEWNGRIEGLALTADDQRDDGRDASARILRRVDDSAGDDLMSSRSL
ncbi:MAG TPA: DUF1573 domain-containing protein, partial [Bacteroidetes bacterium]|nr:DUF1573 domain-containing protein [Bacteroidota bacterium]